MTVGVTSSELLDAVEDLKPALAHLDELTAGGARISMSARDLAAARRAAFELSNKVPGLHALGLLLQTNAAERELLVSRLSSDEATLGRLRSILHVFDREPILAQAMASVHPYSFAVRGEAAWNTYRAWLRALRDQPLWGVADEVRVPLSSVYVPPDYSEHLWTRPSRDDITPREEPSEPVWNDPRPRLRELLGASEEQRANPLFVVGGPGSGKSTLAKMFASELAEDPTVQPLLVRLREVHPERDLFEEIARTLGDLALPDDVGAQLAGVFPHAPRLVLLLDGFDELIQASRTGLGSFFLRLRDLLRDERVHAVVCFGRDTVFDSRETALSDGVRVLTLRAFRPAQVDAWCLAWNRATGSSFDAREYRATEDDGDALSALMSEPLPLFLMALLHRQGALPEAGAIDLAVVYRAVIHATCQRHQDERRSVTAAELRRFLRVLGFAVVQSGSELIRLPELTRALKATGVSFDAAETESRATQLILAISQRRSQREERAWEFIHRSLGEYLAAEFLASEVPLMVAEETDEFGERRYRMDEIALTRRWIERFGPTVLTLGVERFLVKMAGDWPAFGRGVTKLELDRDVDALAKRLGDVYRRLVDEDDAEAVVAVARAWEIAPSSVLAIAIRNVFLVAALPTPGRLDERFAPERAASGRFVKAYWLGGLDEVVRSGFRRTCIAVDLSGIASGTVFVRARLRDLSIANSVVRDLWMHASKFDLLRLLDCVFEDAHLVDVNAELASAKNVIFRACRISGTLIVSGEVSGWRFENCNLRGLRIVGREQSIDGYVERHLSSNGNYIGSERYTTPSDDAPPAS